MVNEGFTPKIILKASFSLLPELKGKTVLEFGNKKNHYGVWRDDYLRAGVKSYHSVDLNGLDGAIPIDLRSESAAEQIKEATGLDSFDIITNFGTSEHIPVQRTFYKCVHNISKPGTFVVHWTPRAHCFKEHGFHGSIWHCNDNFFEELTKANNYKVIKPLEFMNGFKISTCVLQMQEQTEFVWLEEFNDLFWYNELWEKSPDAKLFQELREGWFDPID